MKKKICQYLSDVLVEIPEMVLMEDTYEAIRAIRMLFMGHPMAKSVKIPKYLLEGRNIVFY